MNKMYSTHNRTSKLRCCFIFSYMSMYMIGVKTPYIGSREQYLLQGAFGLCPQGICFPYSTLSTRPTKLTVNNLETFEKAV